MLPLYIEEDTTEDDKNEDGDAMRDEDKQRYVINNFSILTTVTDKKWGIKVTEYLDESTGEIISAKDAKDMFGVKSVYPDAMVNRNKKICSLKDGPRDFAVFILQFRNNNCGFKVSFETLIDWYANLVGKKAFHVRRYIKPLVDAGVLSMVEGIPFLHEDFMIASGKNDRAYVKGEVFRARCLYDNMLAERGVDVEGMKSSIKD